MLEQPIDQREIKRSTGLKLDSGWTGWSASCHDHPWQAKPQGKTEKGRNQLPGKRSVRQSPLAVLTSTPISTGSWPGPMWSCHQLIASDQAASNDS